MKTETSRCDDAPLERRGHEMYFLSAHGCRSGHSGPLGVVDPSQRPTGSLHLGPEVGTAFGGPLKTGCAGLQAARPDMSSGLGERQNRYQDQLIRRRTKWPTKASAPPPSSAPRRRSSSRSLPTQLTLTYDWSAVPGSLREHIGSRRSRQTTWATPSPTSPTWPPLDKLGDLRTAQLLLKRYRASA